MGQGRGQKEARGGWEEEKESRCSEVQGQHFARERWCLGNLVIAESDLAISWSSTWS